MKVIGPSFEVIFPEDVGSTLRLIEVAGRTCYKSEGKMSKDSASGFVRRVIASGHESVIEHSMITVRFICDRGVSHELVRHRLASFSQESTRYCNYSKAEFGKSLTFIKPPWVSGVVMQKVINSSDLTPADFIWLSQMYKAEETYLGLLDCGWSPQQARSVLPNSLKTEVVMTANFREWKHILELRTSTKAHPQMRELMLPFGNHLHGLLPEVFRRYGDQRDEITGA